MIQEGKPLRGALTLLTRVLWIEIHGYAWGCRYATYLQD
jgi:hypothetical protein